jgi:hypothetical protein
LYANFVSLSEPYLLMQIFISAQNLVHFHALRHVTICTLFLLTSLPSELARSVTLPPCFRDVADSNLGRYTGFLRFLVFFVSPSRTAILNGWSANHWGSARLFFPSSYDLKKKKCFTAYFVIFLKYNSVAGIGAGYKLDDREVGGQVPAGSKNFLFSTSSRPALESTQPPIQWVLGPFSPGVKRQGCEADHSPAANAEVNKMWIYTSTPPYAFIA